MKQRVLGVLKSGLAFFIVILVLVPIDMIVSIISPPDDSEHDHPSHID